MGRKINAAKASLVAAFVAAGGAAAAGAAPSTSAHQARPAAGAGFPVKWGDPLIRFLKLDGFPSYFKYDGFAQLANYYKDRLLSDAAAAYEKFPKQVDDLLSSYWKADGGQLTGILIGLETYWKQDGNLKPLLDYLKTPGAMDAYVKFWDVLDVFQKIAPENGGGAFEFFQKETGIRANPLQSRDLDGQLG